MASANEEQEPKPSRKFGKKKHLPLGSGPYLVACVDIMTSGSEQDEGIFFRLYYPTQSGDIYDSHSKWPNWLPRKQYAKGYAYFRGSYQKAMKKFIQFSSKNIFVPVVWNAPIFEEPSCPFPVALFSHGLGGNRTTYTTVCIDLASHGFIVAAVEHRDGSASITMKLRPISTCTDLASQVEQAGSETSPSLTRNYSFSEEWSLYDRPERIDDFDIRNRQLHHRMDECSKVLDYLVALNRGEAPTNDLDEEGDFSYFMFKDKMDFSKTIMIGHSFGGATTLGSLSSDHRFSVGVCLDTWMLPLDDEMYDIVKVPQPILFINTEHFQWRKNIEQMQKFVDMATPTTGASGGGDNNNWHRIMLTLKGTVHQSQTDFQFLVGKRLATFFRLRNTTDPLTAIKLNCSATIGFIRKHLDIDGDFHEDILCGQHDLVIVGSNVVE